MAVYQFYAELEDYKPKIWRRFLVDGDITIARFAYVVMAMYEMEASHLLVMEHERPFKTPSGRNSKRMELINRYGIPHDDEFFPFEDVDATTTKLSDLDLSDPYRLLIWYDMGDDWRVVCKLEEILETSPEHELLPHVLKGKGHGIVEDCGGIYGLADLADAFEVKQGEEYERYKEWLGTNDLDLTAFDIDDINLRIKKLPNIYAKIYEQNHEPTEGEIAFIEREYLEA